MNKEHAKWAKVVGRKIEAEIKFKYGNAWHQFGAGLRSDIIHGRLLYALLDVERFTNGGLLDGEFEARVNALRDYLMPHINPEY